MAAYKAQREEAYRKMVAGVRDVRQRATALLCFWALLRLVCTGEGLARQRHLWAVCEAKR